MMTFLLEENWVIGYFMKPAGGGGVSGTVVPGIFRGIQEPGDVSPPGVVLGRQSKGR
ncbi:hypothetical protein [Zavarzinella formosa]|uniref:hypothetical protein n=1 Tax=Zavarzinella formosa TaxID=360055 RepID=UPI00030B6C52|nr:hypothetical protein [Zavarzinella formosa]